MKILTTRTECYAALHDALDYVKAIQAAILRGEDVVAGVDQSRLSKRLGEARAAMDAAAAIMDEA